VASYADFRELLDEENDLDFVKVMTSDRLHATVSNAAMKRHKHVLMHTCSVQRWAMAAGHISTFDEA
jgi:hypothetical protein